MDYAIRSTSEYKKSPLEMTLKFLETSIDGLAESEVGKRLERFGYNEIGREKEESLS